MHRFVNWKVYGASQGKHYFLLFEVKLFWVVMPRSIVVGYQRFRGLCCLHLQGKVTEKESSIVVWNIGILLKQHMVSQPRRPWCESSLLWKPQISHCFLVAERKTPVVAWIKRTLYSRYWVKISLLLVSIIILHTMVLRQWISCLQFLWLNTKNSVDIRFKALPSFFPQSWNVKPEYLFAPSV
jgi:hypothetical protein